LIWTSALVLAWLILDSIAVVYGLR